MPGIPVKLHPFYYLDHFEEMLSFLEKNCAALLGEGEQAFVRDFRALPPDARALVVRLANRSGSHARISNLRYNELREIPAVLALLSEAGFIRYPGGPDHTDLILTLTRSEIVNLLKPTKGLSSKPKAELLRMVFQGAEAIRLPDDMLADFVIQQRVETIGFLFFLFFGKHRKNLQPLALRDLGIMKTRTGQSSFEVRFKTREAATHGFFYARISAEIGSGEGAGLVHLAESVPDWPVCSEPAAEGVRDREICRLGARLEQAGLADDAMKAYLHATGHPARERICRILFSKNETGRAKELLEQIISNPSSDEELLFAEDFHARKFGTRKLSRLTHLLRSAPVIEIDEAFRDSAEDAVVEHFRKEGERAFRTENQLWISLFGLLFWDQLQGGNGETKHNEFEHRPTQLADGTFFTRNEAAINRQLALLHAGSVLPHLESVIEAHEGKPNGVFGWRRDTLPLIRELISHGPPGAIEAILRRMAVDPSMGDAGFPDLMVVAGGNLRFVEVKAEGDQIRRHQLVRMQVLEKEGFTVEVVRVRWFADPDQEYVVVDVETTGGRAAHHRVTEIGAVKVRGGRVIDRFSTLVNPGRRIPREITRITGISDAMVADAPEFSEISGAFREFVGKAVFVAHNARFDHGFLREEYHRIGENFRCPTLCTVVAMRRFYPGLPSYSLARLAGHFGIPLESHHRALCDAEATAELLRLINARRNGMD
ncbi:VRR-NUC domain-containing protein [Luteolibacter yonseiensis]|uniref:VRR-NUC domain-containing protein n=1 Tax=Luteolibacter yonseiensis TaxID=1144680 RepID=A0A934R6S0_9BACT|nr:exonuclease domain-containing protein [Luteolibacter yonseiensis]MBK1818037.1 VRR-NUC domain-containing protein [Luteolibacter yonseiensis]